MGWEITMMVLMIVLAAALIVGVVWLIRTTTRSRSEDRASAAPDRDDPLRVLERRFAEGAIGIEEYRERRGTLESRR